MNDELPSWLTIEEAAFQVALWLYRQPDRSLHNMRVLCELAELPDYLRDSLIEPPWQRREEKRQRRRG